MLEIQAGREGLWGVKNKNAVPLGSLLMLRNATLEDHSWRTGGGAAKLGEPVPGGPACMKGIDYWPDTATQRTIMLCADGTIRKDDGTGRNWITLASGLTLTGIVPHFTITGQEAAGKLRRVFYADGVNAPLVLTGDAGAMTAITAPPADWSGSNQPIFFAPHQGFLWSAGAKNAPHTLYRSQLTDVMNWTTVPYSLPIYPGESERLIGGLSYKGGLILLKRPEGGYFVDTSAASDTAWRVLKVAGPGGVGAGAMAHLEDDLFWVSEDGSWHMISATLAAGSVRASDLTYRKLGGFFRDAMNLAQLARSELIYYSLKQELMLAGAAVGQTAKNRRVHLDLNRRQDLGERWVFWDRDVNETLFLRKVNNVLVPHFGDAQGQLWALDQVGRSIAGVGGYLFEWFTMDTDFGQVSPQFRSRKKNLRFLQLEFDPRSAGLHTVELHLDGRLRQTILFNLAGGTPLPVVLPVVLGTASLQLTTRRRALGQFTRLAIRGFSSEPGQDISITKVMIGLELAEESAQVGTAA